MALKLENQNNTFRITGQGFQTKWIADTEANRKVVLIVMNNILNNEGKLLFSLKDLEILETKRQIKQYLEDFYDKGKDFLSFLFRGQVIDKMIMEKKDNKFRILSKDIETIWLPDTNENRKTMLVALRCLCDKRGRHLFSHDNLKVILENSARQASGNIWDEFKYCGENFLCFLKRRKQITDEMLSEDLLKILNQKPLLSEDELVSHLRKSSGKSGIGRNRVRKLLEAISCSKIRQTLRQQIASGQAHYKEEVIINELFDLIDLDVPEIGIDKEIILSKQAEKPLSCNIKKIPDSSKTQFLFENKQVDQLTISNIWESTIGWKLLAFVLYFHGVSLSAIGNWFGVHKSTVCRWLEYISHWGSDWMSEFKATFSGKVAIDEKWIKVAGEWQYLFAAVDCTTRYPLLVSLYPSNNSYYCRLFLTCLRKKGYYPKIIITDGWNAYIGAMKAVFPKAEHQICQFHLLHSIYVRMHKAKIFDTSVSIAIGKVFQTLYKRTVYRRIEKVKTLLDKSQIEPVLSGLFRKLPKTIKAVGNNKRPRTANCVEHFFGRFDRFYRLKHAFCDVNSAEKHIRLFMLGYVFAIKANGKPSPLENAGCNVKNIIFYHLFNQPNLMALKQRISLQYSTAA